MTANVLALRAAVAGQPTLNEVLSRYSLEMRELGDASVDTSHLRRTSDGKALHRISAQTKGTQIEIEIVTPLEAAQATSLSRSHYQTIERLYGDQRSPYTGEITNLLSCAKDKRPQYEQVSIFGEKQKALFGYATTRFIFGACDDASAKQMGTFLSAYDKTSKTLFRVRLFHAASSSSKSLLIQALAGIRRLEK